MPRLVRGPTSHAAPSSYALAPNEAFVPESVTATFDGSGAAGAFLPTLSVYAQSGELLARSPATEVAAGSSAEVTFAPLLRAAASGGGTTVIDVPFANWTSVGGTDNIAGGGGVVTHLAGQFFETNDSSVFEMGASSGGGPANVLLIKAPGIYTTWAFAVFQVDISHADEPAASVMYCSWDSFNYPATELDTFHWQQQATVGILNEPLATRNKWHPWGSDTIDYDGAAAPPYMEYVPALYNRGVQPQTVQSNLLSVRWSESRAIFFP